MRLHLRSSKRTRPIFDQLEPRITPTTFVWTGVDANASWSDPNNWSHIVPYTGLPTTGVPTAYSDVIFPSNPLLTSNDNTINLNFAYLGFPLNSLSVASSYTFDGNPLTIENNLSILTDFGSPATATFLNTGLYFAPGAEIDTATDATLNIASSSDTTGLYMNLYGNLTLFGGGQVVIDTTNITYPNTAPFAPTYLNLAGGTLTFGASESLRGINLGVGHQASLIVPDDASLQVGTLTGSGTVELEGTTATDDSTSLSVNVPYATSATFNGLIDGIGQFTNAGNGTETTAAIDFSSSGSIAVTAGTLIVDGPISAGTLQVSTLGTFGGLGTWRFSGAATFQSGATFDISLNGTNPGSQYTQLVDTSSTGITLNATNLSGAVGYEYEQGDTDTILSAPSITGVFQNVESGQVFLDGNIPYNVNSTGSTVSVIAINSVTTTELYSSSSAVHPGQPVTFTAYVSTRTTGVNSGDVTFLQGGTAVATLPLSSNGTATFTTSSLPLGASSISAAYLGYTSTLSSASRTVLQYVVPYSTTTTLSSLANPANPGQPVTLVATVVAGGVPVTTGTVSFRSGTHILATLSLTAFGTASLTLSSLSLGKTKVQAIYNGASGETSSASALFVQSIEPFDTATEISLTAEPAARSTLTASVLIVGLGEPSPTGTVLFRRNGIIIGRAKLVDGTATLLLPKRVKLTGHFTAAYQGNPRFRASRSTAISG